MICYIPSKNRPNTKTHLLFKNADIKVIHFLEPKDYKIYDVPNKINIKKTNQGSNSRALEPIKKQIKASVLLEILC